MGRPGRSAGPGPARGRISSQTPQRNGSGIGRALNPLIRSRSGPPQRAGQSYDGRRGRRCAAETRLADPRSGPPRHRAPGKTACPRVAVLPTPLRNASSKKTVTASSGTLLWTDVTGSQSGGLGSRCSFGEIALPTFADRLATTGGQDAQSSPRKPRSHPESQVRRSLSTNRSPGSE